MVNAIREGSPGEFRVTKTGEASCGQVCPLLRFFDLNKSPRPWRPRVPCRRFEKWPPLEGLKMPPLFATRREQLQWASKRKRSTVNAIGEGSPGKFRERTPETSCGQDCPLLRFFDRNKSPRPRRPQAPCRRFEKWPPNLGLKNAASSLNPKRAAPMSLKMQEIHCKNSQERMW